MPHVTPQAPTKLVRLRIVDALDAFLARSISGRELWQVFEDSLFDCSGGKAPILDLTHRELQILCDFSREYLDRFTETPKEYGGLLGRYRKWQDYSDGELTVGPEEMREAARLLLAQLKSIRRKA